MDKRAVVNLCFPTDYLVTPPQLDSCVASIVGNVSPFQYAVLPYAPSSVDLSNVVVTIRSNEDPVAVAGAITDGTMDFKVPV
jgi:hypothetical protein